MEGFIFSKISDSYKNALELSSTDTFITRQTINHIIKKRGNEKGRLLLNKTSEILMDPTEVLPNYRSGKIISDEFWFVKRDNDAIIVIVEITKTRDGLNVKTVMDKSINDLNRVKRRIQESGGRPVLPIAPI